jgi:dihydrofolate reductase
MIISLIVAADENNGIGLDGKLPWYLPADLARFKEITMGHHLLVGRKTFQSIGKSLPGRQMIILSRDPDLMIEGCTTVASLEEGLQMAEAAGDDEAFVIGGGEIYLEALHIADRLYLTRVHGVFEADTYFPRFDETNWALEFYEYHPADERNAYPFTFQIFSRQGE